MASTFNPLNFSRSDFEVALGGGRDYANAKDDIHDDITTLESDVDALTRSTESISDTLTALTGSFASHVDDNKDSFAEVKDLIERIIYKGSNNQIDLSGATVSLVPSDINVSMEYDGVLKFIKPSVTENDWTITISGFALAVGEYYKSTGDDIPSNAGEVVTMTFWNGPSGESGSDWIGYPVVNTDPIDQSVYSNVTTAVSNGDIVIKIDKNYTTNVWRHLVPTCALKPYDKAYSMPKFSPISGV